MLTAFLSGVLTRPFYLPGPTSNGVLGVAARHHYCSDLKRGTKAKLWAPCMRAGRAAPLVPPPSFNNFDAERLNHCIATQTRRLLYQDSAYLIVTIICEYKILRFWESDDFAGIKGKLHSKIISSDMIEFFP